jgi:ComF family protein
MDNPPAYACARTLYPYVPPLQDAICLLKYRGKVALVPSLSRLMIEHLPTRDRVDVVIPVPLHSDRLRAREFNQSLLLAHRIARHLRLPLSCTALVRLAASAPQTILSRKERLSNLRGAFAVPEPGLLTGKRILLVDDVFTTGATMNECARTLTQAGSGEVFALTLARTMESHLIPDRIQAQHTRPAWGILGG